MPRLTAIRLILLAGVLAGCIAQHVVANDNYFADPEFFGGQWRSDNMGRQNHHGHLRAQRMLALEGGDVIIAGMVPPSTGDPNWSRNVGLARYDRNGFYDPGLGWQRVVYPDNELVRFIEVVDMILSPDGSRLLVLVSDIDASTEPAPTTTARLLSFNLETGALLQSIAVLNVANRDDYPAGMGLHFGSELKLVIAGTAQTESGSRPVMQLVDITLEGEVIDFIQPPPILIQAAIFESPSASAYINGIAIVGGVFSTPRIYLGGTFVWSGPQAEDFFAARVDIEGNVDPHFGTGVTIVGFDEDESSNSDKLVDIVAYNTSGLFEPPDDRILLVGTVDRTCKTGIGVVRLIHSGSHLSGDFGENGKVLFGGSSSSETFSCILASTNTAAAAALAPGGRLVIAGQTRQGGLCPFPCDKPREHGSLAVVDVESGEVSQSDFFPFYSGTSIERESTLLDIADAGSGRLVATGYSIYPDDYSIPDLQGKQRYATLGFIMDRLFSDRFEQ